MGARKQRKPVEVVPPPPPPSRSARFRQALRRATPAVIATGAVSVCVLVLALIFGQAPLLVGAAPDPDADRDLSAGGSEFLDVDDPRRVLQGTGSPTETLTTVGPPSTTIPSDHRRGLDAPAVVRPVGEFRPDPGGRSPRSAGRGSNRRARRRPPTRRRLTPRRSLRRPNRRRLSRRPRSRRRLSLRPPSRRRRAADDVPANVATDVATRRPTTQPPTTSQPPCVPPTYPDPPGC